MKFPEDGTPWLSDLYRELRALKPMLNHEGSAHENLGCLAAALHPYLTVSHMALLPLTESGEAGECLCWSRDGGRPEQEFQRAVKACLPALLHAMKERDDGDGLADLLEHFEGGAAGEHFTAYPIAPRENLKGIAFFAKPAGAGAWTKEERKAALFHMPFLEACFFSDTQGGSSLQSRIFHSMMDSMNANLYITDPRTSEILFMNRAMRETFGLEHPEGEICWKVLQKGLKSRCAFCPVDQLLRMGGENASYQWEENNTATGRVFQNFDGLVRWQDGRLVHFQQSIDITDVKKRTEAAQTDELTGLLNRTAGRARLEETMRHSMMENVPFSICLFDVNALKEINDIYGHTEGDLLVTSITELVREQLREKDFAFRLSGDEFVVVFYKLGKASTTQKLVQIQKKLREKKESLGILHEFGFCYGVLEVSADNKLPYKDLMARADEVMYEQKRRYHIQKREQALQDKVQRAGGGEPEFDYDRDLLYRALVQSTDDYIYICNMKTDTFRYPRTMVEKFDLPGEIIQNAAAVWGARIHEHDKAAFLEANQELMDGRTDSHCVEYRAMDRDGKWEWLRCRGHLERDANGEPALFAGMISSLGKRNKIDHMTGLLNKFEFENEIHRRMESPTTQWLGMMILGMDDFRHVNDLYNRAFGDEVIRVSSQRIQSLLPENAELYRLDGDEFGIVVANGNRGDMRRIYAGVRNLCRHQQECDGKKYYCTLSAGCAVFPDDADNYQDLLKYANYSLEYSKNKGKNCNTFFSREILIHKKRSLEMIELLRESVEHGFAGFELYYQPQVHATTGKVLGAEALVRWKSERFGAVSPVEFIPLLENSGLIIPVGKWIFKKAISKCKEWTIPHPGFVMSVNLSYVQVTGDNFISFMEDMLRKVNLSPKNLVVELTESQLMKGNHSVQGVFDDIRRLGIRIAMDDFGTGYSSLGILKNSPADIVKIDRVFVKDIKTSNFDATFIRFIVALCHDVGIKVCQEGVETEEEYQLLNSMELDSIQGFLFGKPMPDHQFYTRFLQTAAFPY